MITPESVVHTICLIVSDFFDQQNLQLYHLKKKLVSFVYEWSAITAFECLSTGVLIQLFHVLCFSNRMSFAYDFVDTVKTIKPDANARPVSLSASSLPRMPLRFWTNIAVTLLHIRREFNFLIVSLQALARGSFGGSDPSLLPEKIFYICFFT